MDGGKNRAAFSQNGESLQEIAPAARRLARLLLAEDPASEQALAACGPRYYEGCGPGKGRCPRKRQDPRGALPFFSPAASPKRRAKTFDYDALIFLFAAQPIKVFRRGLFSKRPERSRLSFSPKPFFKKAGGYSASRPQHFLYFLPLPQGQGSFRPTFLTVRGRFSSVPSLSPRLS